MRPEPRRSSRHHVVRDDVEVFADVTCPFAHVGLRRFVARREELAVPRPLLRVRAWPLEFVNGQPLEPALVASHVDELRSQVAPDLFQGFDPDVVPGSSLPALELVAAAYQVSTALGERVSLLVRDALFEHGLDIAETGVLAAIAAATNVTVDARAAERVVRADYEEGQRRGVRGSPEFFVDGTGWYCPSLRITKEGDALSIELDTDRVAAFLEACFA